MRLKFYDTNNNSGDYIDLNRGTLRIIRKSFFKVSKKYVAACCGINPHTYSRAERCNQNVRKDTLTKIYSFFIDNLAKRGWKLRREEFEGMNNV